MHATAGITKDINHKCQYAIDAELCRRAACRKHVAAGQPGWLSSEEENAHNTRQQATEGATQGHGSRHSYGCISQLATRKPQQTREAPAITHT